MAIAKGFVKLGGDLAKGTFGGSGIEWRNINQMYFPRAESLGTAKDLGDVETRLEMVKYEDEIMFPGGSHLVAPLFFLEAEQSVLPAILTLFTFLTTDHW